MIALETRGMMTFDLPSLKLTACILPKNRTGGNMQDLGHWAVIDIETTGVDPSYDEIIDLGFLQFEGTKLVRKYSSLVRTENKLSQFIQKLTGIRQNDVKKAPVWEKVVQDLWDLEGHALIAHNSSFEEQFLSQSFEDLGGEREPETFNDSMYFLSLLFPERSTLSLEGFIIDLKIADSEEHRGLSDSIDLLKVMLLAVYITHFDRELRLFMQDQLDRFRKEEFWFKSFYQLEKDELIEIAEQIEFDLDETLEKYKASLNTPEEFHASSDSFNLEFSGENIKFILQSEEQVKHKLPYYTYRPSQEQLALRVGQSFKNDIHALIQAPTGTGKTLGYLLPSILKAKDSKEQVLISTGTKTLQNQAMAKDIPGAKQLLGLEDSQLKVLRLIGSSNHFCELLFRSEEDENLLDLNTFEEKFSKAYFEAAFFNNRRVQDYNNVITRENIPFVLKRKLKAFNELEEEIQVDFRACTGNKCPFKTECSYLQGLRKAKEADVIVGNHALTLSWPRGVERPKYIVIDEAHKLEGEATRAFSSELTQAELENFARNLSSMVAPVYYLLGAEKGDDELVQRIRKEASSTSKMIEENISELKNLIERFARKLPNYTDIYWNEFLMFNKDQLKDSLQASLYNQVDSLRYIFRGFYELILPLMNRWSMNTLNDENDLKAFSLFESNAGHIEESYLTLERLMEDTVKYVSSIKFHDEYGFLFSSSPVDVGELFYENVLQDSASTVFTSATLTNSDGSMGMGQVEWMTGYHLLPSEKRFKSGLFLQNNYDYKNNAKVFLCTDTVSFYDQDYVPSTMKQLIPLIRDIGGRTLLLFSSRVRFDKACELLLEAFDGEIPLFIQGLGKNIVEEFKRSEHGVLVGMESFGEGIDIPGDNLVFVYIDKVPDLRQDLIIQKRRDFYESRFGNEFNDYFLGHRTRSLHQKLGRLIRRESDKGCVIVTDSRLSRWKHRTLDTFSQMMKPYDLQVVPFEKACEEARDFLL